jgi:putative transposase
MTNIRRYFRPGDISFLTHVTYKRMPILTDNFDLLCTVWHSIKAQSQVELLAWVVLPDHMHVLVENHGDDLSYLTKRFKLSFSHHYRKNHGLNRGRIWQYRFWDHIIRNGDDLNRHIDYIHYNPIKHGLSSDPRQYHFSSFHDFCARGYYEEDWGCKQNIELDGEFGE